MTITKEMVAKEYRYDADKGQLIKLDSSSRKRKEPEERTAKYQSVFIDGDMVKEHRAIWILHNGPIPDALRVDHKDGNSNNNRIENLRLCTITQNNQNKTIYKRSRSGYKGVIHCQRDKSRFSCHIRVDGEQMLLGIFDSAIEAAKAYDLAAAKYFGEFARTNRDLGLL